MMCLYSCCQWGIMDMCTITLSQFHASYYSVYYYYYCNNCCCAVTVVMICPFLCDVTVAALHARQNCSLVPGLHRYLCRGLRSIPGNISSTGFIRWLQHFQTKGREGWAADCYETFAKRCVGRPPPLWHAVTKTGCFSNVTP